MAIRRQTGSTPLQRLLAARVRRAQQMLETGRHTIDATASGFGSTVTFRARFRQVVGISPNACRRRFSGGA